MNKPATDILAILLLAVAITTGMMLHIDVHHSHVYNNVALWTIHEISGGLLLAAAAMHAVQHKQWFRNYARIPAHKKRPITILDLVLAALGITGIVLLCGSHSHGVSIAHYALGIAFTVLAAAHALKRRKILVALFK